MPASLIFVTVCPWCGEPLDVDRESTWWEATLWGALAQRDHDKIAHPERTK